jgi:hypothetical protein
MFVTDLCGFNLRSHLSSTAHSAQCESHAFANYGTYHTTILSRTPSSVIPFSLSTGRRLPPPPPSPPSSSSSRRERARSPQPAPAASAVTRMWTQSDAERESDRVRRRRQPGGVVVALNLSWLRQQSDARRPACIAVRGNPLLLRTSDGSILALARSA